jgi:curli biogenesis system outer membrane secretion channel CsgG
MRRAVLISLASVLVLAGCGATKTITQTATVSTTETDTSTVTHLTGPTKTISVTTTTTSTATVTSTPSASNSFSGNGGKNLGTITVNADSTVHWTNDGGLFQVFDSDAGLGLTINSQGHSGTSALSAGTYHNVVVNADGNWTLQIVPS